MSVQAKLEVVRRKHIVHHTGFGAYSSTCYKGTDNCAGTMGVDQLPSFYDNLFIYQVLCTLIYRRRSLYSFLQVIKTESHRDGRTGRPRTLL